MEPTELSFLSLPDRFAQARERAIPIEWYATPSPQLQPYVACYRGLILPPHLPQKFMQWASPSGQVVMYFSFGGGKVYENEAPYGASENIASRPNWGIIRPKAQMWAVSLEQATDVVLVSFKNGMATPFLNAPLTGLDSWFAPSEIWSRTATNQLGDLEPLRPHARVEVIEHILKTQLQQSKVPADDIVCAAIQLLRYGGGQTTVGSLEDKLGMTSRHLRRKFQQHVGLTPKQLNNIIRLQVALQTAHQNPDWSLSRIAHQANYFDQAHFSRSAKLLMGRTPSQLLTFVQTDNAQRARQLMRYRFTA